MFRPRFRTSRANGRVVPYADKDISRTCSLRHCLLLEPNSLVTPGGGCNREECPRGGPGWNYLVAGGGVYHTGDVQARCCTVAATFGFGGRFSLADQYVDQRGVGISSTRA